MMNKIPGSVRDQIDSMLRLGPAVGLTDGQLLDRVDGSGGEPAEAAFAALVERHGPMVLRVCRDSTGNPHDAEDAFQAVFLVLARKAGSVRRRDSAASWLFGVARKVSSRARRDEARRRRHEARKAELSARSPSDAARPESWEELHEEIDRLPEHYRSAVVLCHLEGLTHEEAAARLRCPLRTLQSRLLRARARLRDRLARRGVAPSAILGAAPPSSALPAKLAASTSRIALSEPAGMVPGAVKSLADGVLAMSPLARWKVMAFATMAVGAAAGFALAFGPRRSRPAAGPVAAVVAPARPEARAAVAGDRGRVMARGVVVDEEGHPVAGAEVIAIAFTTRESRGVSAADGSFAVPVRQIDGTGLLVRSAAGNRLGTFRYGFSLTREQAEAPARIALKPGRRISARVLDATGAPVSDATVDVIGDLQALAEGTTGDDGGVDLVIPADAKVNWVVALKSGRGLDYAEFGPIDDQRRAPGGTPASEIRSAVSLALDGARTVKIRAVDVDGRPLAEIGFGPWTIAKAGRRTMLNLGDY